MTAQEIKDALDAGIQVSYGESGSVIKDSKGQYLIKVGEHYIGLQWADGTLADSEDKFTVLKEAGHICPYCGHIEMQINNHYSHMMFCKKLDRNEL